MQCYIEYYDLFFLQLSFLELLKTLVFEQILHECEMNWVHGPQTTIIYFENLVEVFFIVSFNDYSFCFIILSCLRTKRLDVCVVKRKR